ncbi:MAG: hypothetical protein NTY64_24425 [Deltaproteobacteria bacterium]|nr:hypothetical protein [Deltaproteobacteria bacterium]
MQDRIISLHLIEWLRMPADLIFIVSGVLPLLVAAGLAYKSLISAKANEGKAGNIGQ